MSKNKDKSTITVVLLVSGACLLYALSGGIRSVYGIIINPICQKSGLSYVQVSFAFGIAQLMYGLTQPLWGALALRRSNTFVLLCGIPLIIAGLLGISFSYSQFTLTFFLGILMASGTGAVSFGVIMASITPILGSEKAANASGILNSSCGVGGAVLAPVIQYTSQSIGINGTLMVFAAIMILTVPIVLWIKVLNANAKNKEKSQKDIMDEPKKSASKILLDAFRNSDYRALMISFGTCGFHMTIIQTHLVTQIVSYGICESTATLIYSAYSIAVIAGAVIAGMVCGRIHLKTVLAALYGIRAAAAAVFIFFMPKTLVPILIFSLILGLTGDATVTPTSEIISRRFGAGAMSFLFGITFVCHQIGGFISSWLGGLFITNSGNYNLIWMIDIILCVLASAVSYKIKVCSGE